MSSAHLVGSSRRLILSGHLVGPSRRQISSIDFIGSSRRFNWSTHRPSSAAGLADSSRYLISPNHLLGSSRQRTPHPHPRTSPPLSPAQRRRPKSKLRIAPMPRPTSLNVSRIPPSGSNSKPKSGPDGESNRSVSNHPKLSRRQGCWPLRGRMLKEWFPTDCRCARVRHGDR